MKQPHIIFLMSDQQRWDALGCVNQLIQTPCLDSLAKSGIRYQDAVCNAPMCVPSRYSMMTGLYPAQCGVRNNGQSTSHDSELQNTPIAEVLRQRGYKTLGFGKTHWYDSRNSNCPSARGFEKIWQSRKADNNIYPPGSVIWSEDEPDVYGRWKAEQAHIPRGGEDFNGYRGLRSEVPAEEHREGWLTRKCLEELDRIEKTEELVDTPLFLYFSLDFPHAGLFVPAEFEDKYDINDIPDRPLAEWYKMDESHRPHAHIEDFHDKWSQLSTEERRWTTLRYFAATTYLDDCFGQVISKLDAMGILDDSLIIMTADHGEMLGDRDHRFSKYCLYEGSIRVPLILSGNRIAESLRGTVDKRPAELIDLYPTLLEISGATPRPELPGSSLLHPPQRVGAYAEMDGAGGRFEPSQRAPALMWRTAEWKLIIHQPGSLGDAGLRPDDITGELYSLIDDPHELRNRYQDQTCRDIRERLTVQLLMHIAQAHAKWPRFESVLGVEVNQPEDIRETSPRFGVRYWF